MNIWERKYNLGFRNLQYGYYSFNNLDFLVHILTDVGEGSRNEMAGFNWIYYLQKSFWKGRKSFKGGAFDEIPQLIFRVLHRGWAGHQSTSPAPCHLCLCGNTCKATDSSGSWDPAHPVWWLRIYISFEMLVFTKSWRLIAYFEKWDTQICQ